MNEFVLNAALKAAAKVINQQKLAAQTHFVLPKAEWQAFCAALDAPPKIRPALKELMTQPSVFDA